MEIGATHATQSVIFAPEHACSCSRNTHLDSKAGVAAGRVCGCFLTREIIFPALTPETRFSVPVFPKLLCIPVASDEEWLIPTDTHARTSPAPRLISGVIPLLPILYEGVSSTPQAWAQFLGL